MEEGAIILDSRLKTQDSRLKTQNSKLKILDHALRKTAFLFGLPWLSVIIGQIEGH
jgi:hypothetical protein